MRELTEKDVQLQRHKNILISAIACSPSLGSEHGVGWNWAIELVRAGHHVTVITRKESKEDIEAFMAREPDISIQFVFVDLIPSVSYIGSPSIPAYLYIYLWQVLAYLAARKIVAKNDIDVVHHVTFAGIRLPSFMGALGLPFLLGPVGGGEESPPKLLSSFPFRARLKERVRRLSNQLVKVDPLMRYTMSKASVIGVTTKDNLRVIPSRYHKKVIVSSTIGISVPDTPPLLPKNREEIVVLFVGRFLFWKGMHLGISAFAQACRSDSRLRLIMVGTGPAEPAWRKLAKDLDIDEKVTWKNWVPKESLPQIYQDADIFLFPSLHDSGGMVVLEAATQGLPTVCLDLGGPGSMVNERNGRKIAVAGLSESAVVSALASSLIELSADRNRLEHLSHSAQSWVTEQDWATVVGRFYASCDERLTELGRA